MIIISYKYTMGTNIACLATWAAVDARFARKPRMPKRFCTRIREADTRFVQENMPLVLAIARRVLRRLPPNVVLDDLVGAGTLGLVDCIARHRGDDDCSFANYARIRIRGAIFDELRAHDWLPRRGRSPRRPGAGVATEKTSVVHLEDLPRGAQRTLLDPCSADNPHEALSRKRTLALVRQGMGRLPQRDRMILGLHYFKGMRLKEIGRLLGVSEGRVSQIHHRALAVLRPHLEAAA